MQVQTVETYFWLSAVMLSSKRAVVLLLAAASSVAAVISWAPPSEGAAAPETAARFKGGSGALMSFTASYSSRICTTAEYLCSALTNFAVNDRISAGYSL